MTMNDLTLRDLTAEAFSPYGEVLEADPAKSFLINNGSTRRFHDLAEVDAGEGGVPIISIFRGIQCVTPIEIRMLERHPLATQAFFPLAAFSWLVVVAEGETPEAKDCQAFLARGDQGVQLAVGTWHHPLLVLDTVQDFLVIDRKGPGANLEERLFSGETCRVSIS